MGDRIFVVPYDFSVHARAALFAATDLARRLGADLYLIHVIQPPAHVYGYAGYAGVAPPPLDMAGIRESALKTLQQVADEVGNLPGRIESHISEGSSIADLICEFAEKMGADLIVMGTRGHTGLAHVFLGSVAERTLRSAPCPVLTLRSPEDEEGS